MSAIIAFLSKLLTDVLSMVLSKPKVTGTIKHGKNTLIETPADELAEKARRSGLLLLLALLCLGGCGTTHVVVATVYPAEDVPSGWPRVAQDEILVILDDGTIGTVKGAAGYRIVHDTDLKALVKRAGLVK